MERIQRTILVLMLILSAPILGVAAETKPPNIVILFADDLGYGDIGVYGCQDVPTPHIDSIASNGVKFTDGYATHHVCCPSRAGLLSGMYQHRFGFEHNSGPPRFAADNFGFPRNIPMLSEKLKAAGYTTGFVGKWHIGFKEGLRPHERGFDYSYGFLAGARTFYPDPNGDPILRNGERVEEREYLTDDFAREAVDFIGRSKQKPFFLYLAFNAVHAPLEATDKYEARFPNITDPKRKTYAGMLSAMDDAVGRVLAKLREEGLEENTFIAFYSDNGGPTWQTTSRNDPLRGSKAEVYEGGIRVPFILQWKGTLPAGETYRKPVMGFDVHATALAIAGVSTSEDKPIDGVNLIPFAKGERQEAPHEALFWRAGEQYAARVGDWKLVRFPADQDEPQLFNLKDDIGERRDLAAANPEKLKELQTKYEAWSKQMMPAQWVRQTGPNDRYTSPEARAEQRFSRLDRDRDGKLTPQEMDAARRGRAALRAADTNGDGFLSLDEMKALMLRGEN